MLPSDVEEAEEALGEFDAGSPRHVRERAKAAKRKQQSLDNAMLAMLETHDCRLWLWELLGLCGVYATSFSPDPALMAFREGRRDVGLRLIADINRLAPDRYVEMAREAAERDKPRE